jgi:hypothetical protein
MKTAHFLFIGLLTLSLYYPVYAQTAPTQSGPPSAGKKARQVLPPKAVRVTNNPPTYDGPVVVNTQELAEKMRTHSRTTDHLNRLVK